MCLSFVELRRFLLNLFALVISTVISHQMIRRWKCARFMCESCVICWHRQLGIALWSNAPSPPLCVAVLICSNLNMWYESMSLHTRIHIRILIHTIYVCISVNHDLIQSNKIIIQFHMEWCEARCTTTILNLLKWFRLRATSTAQRFSFICQWARAAPRME